MEEKSAKEVWEDWDQLVKDKGGGGGGVRSLFAAVYYADPPAASSPFCSYYLT